MQKRTKKDLLAEIRVLTQDRERLMSKELYHRNSKVRFRAFVADLLAVHGCECYACCAARDARNTDMDRDF
jgi:predicted HNH restriction endonuclease